MAPRTWGYARVSTDEQFGTRLSIDEQRRQIVEHCRKNGLDLGPNDERLREEAESAYKHRFQERPLGKALDAELREGDYVVIAKIDRAFRNMHDAVRCVEDWQKRGVTVRILDMPGSGNPLFDKLILGVLAWAAEFESWRRGERMADAWRSARKKGRHMGLSHAPWGFRWCGKKSDGTAHLEYFPEERETMRLVWSLYQEAHLSIPRICGYLVRNRIAPADRRPPWSRKTNYKPAAVYHQRYVREMLGVEAQLRYYEAAGLSPEAAAEEWLRDYRQNLLPGEDEIRERLTKGEITV